MQIENSLLKQCWILAGPTACGKSATSLELGRRLNAEIISLDSMAIYRGMDIGTAKPSQAERDLLPHHMIDIVDPHEDYSLAEYVPTVELLCEQILARGRVPLFVGGTGLYLRGLLRGVFDGPSADWEFRDELEQRASAQKPGWLHERLKTIDLPSADRLHPNDERRIVRALEVFHLTNQRLSDQQNHTPLPLSQRPRQVLWLDPQRHWIHERVDRRVEQMVEQGLFDEVRGLNAAAKPMGRIARQALGYKEVLDAMEANVDLRESIPIIQTRTRQFAKRQCTWFRNIEECHALPIEPTDTTNDIVEKIMTFSPATNDEST